MNLIERLVEIGYTPEKANDLYNFYDRQGDLDGLESYVIVKESTKDIL